VHRAVPRVGESEFEAVPDETVVRRVLSGAAGILAGGATDRDNDSGESWGREGALRKPPNSIWTLAQWRSAPALKSDAPEPLTSQRTL